ncbi:MAG: hypothetical protein AAF569_06160 [Pseudomonadota bacterium]
MKRILSYLFIPLFLLGCSATSHESYSRYFDRQQVPLPTETNLPHCHNYGCQKVQIVELNESEWAHIEKSFHPKAKTPEQEREQIREAISRFEKVVGKIAKTDEDVWGTFQDMGLYQLDCVDESTNTTAYLIALNDRGKINHHEVNAPSARFLKNGLPGWPHQTAVIREIQSGQRYAVDSWFRNNGYPPFVVAFEDWGKGWTPTDDMRPEIFNKDGDE